ncbi:hypothetical protein DFP72DRAFT_867960 [Ephemerocybe angulata]|uniref:Uncharacterized protein n=1 Tax=Ephemerocybe angulata TaxID=980116 RepID=A0A8H6IH11_9AGAR|nr:hypothetical protein DFP72DRAFT_867960 [Tulosesus angulatus]
MPQARSLNITTGSMPRYEQNPRPGTFQKTTTTNREHNEMGKEKKREKQKEWQAKQAHLDVMWERMDGEATCDKCRRFGVACYRAIHADVHLVPKATNAQKVRVGSNLYSRCEECKVRNRKCEMTERRAGGDIEVGSKDGASTNEAQVIRAPADKVKRERVSEDPVEMVRVDGQPMWKWRRAGTKNERSDSPPGLSFRRPPPLQRQTRNRCVNATGSSSKVSVPARQARAITDFKTKAEIRLRDVERHQDAIRAELAAQQTAQRELWTALYHLEQGAGNAHDGDDGLEYY